MSFQWEGLDELEAGLASVAAGAETVIQSGLMFPAATVGERSMKQSAAVDTGQMKNRTQTSQVSSTQIVWDSDVPYAGYQDFGTARQPGKPFFRSSIVSLARLITKRTPVRLEYTLARSLRSGGVWNPRKLI